MRDWIRSVASCAAAILSAIGPASGADGNLARDGGFDGELENAWERRTPDDASRRSYREEGGGRAGAGVVLENLAPAYTRLRQGHDRGIVIAPGSLVELSAWVRSDQDASGSTTLQIYCMDAGGRILAQPTSIPIRGATEGWVRGRVLTLVPEGSAYVMIYLQTRDGVGRVRFDDVELRVRRGPSPRVPAAPVALLSDLSDDHGIIARARVLFEEGLRRVEPGGAGALRGMAGALALYAGEPPPSLWPALETLARDGGRVFVDIRAFARCHGARAMEVAVGEVDGKSLQERMRAGLRVVRVSDATGGFDVGQILPRARWPDGGLCVLPADLSLAGLETLAEGPGGERGLVRLAVGRGAIFACDLLSLREPLWRNVDAYYAFTPVSGALGNPARLGQYYSRRLTYAGVVEEMRRLVEAHPTIRLEDEGAASEGYRIWSLNLGRQGAPLYFLYAAAHGSEWEPGYGLITFARRLAEGAFGEEIDLEKVRVKLVPLLNPWGYDGRSRQNAAGVDLNRQGDHEWGRYVGRDSDGDGCYGPRDYDWKGASPFVEPEARVVRKIVGDPDLHCILDFHGNASATNNKVGILPATAHPDNELMALELQRIANGRLRGRHLLRQDDEGDVSQYLLDRIWSDAGRPVLMNTAARGRFGLLIELAAGYGESYGTLLQTDVTCEFCRALFLACPPRAR